MPTGTRRRFVRTAAGTALGAALLRPGARSAAADDPSVVGQWSPFYPWPCVGIHLNLLPDGKILTWADDDGAFPPDRLADFSKAFVVSIPHGQPPSMSVTRIDNNVTNLFCAGHSFLPDGRLLVVGGHEGPQYYGSADVTIFESNAPYAWQRRNDAPMDGGRWYATALTMGNGEVLVVGGTKIAKNDNNRLPQVWQTNVGGGWRDLRNAQLDLPYYPTLHLAPDGRAYYSGSLQNTRYLDTTGNGDWSPGPKRKHGNRFYGSTALYDDAKILMAGGGNPPTNSAEIIDLGATTPRWTAVAPMAFARRHMNLTILADGKVLATGGSSAANNDARGGVLAAELWDPASQAWATVASMAIKRLYHSTAMLLPDGRVLSVGGGRPKAGNGGANNLNAEIYSPPYLFQGARPTITSAPATVEYGQTFPVLTPQAADITSARLVRLSSVTHTVNMNQRARTLDYSRLSGSLLLTVPTNPNLLPPGHYLLFILANGVPSVAQIVQVLPAAG